MTLVSLPAADALQLGDLIQWWYWAGLLETVDGRRFGYQAVFFALREGPVRAQLAETALSDLGTGAAGAAAGRYYSREWPFPGEPRALSGAFDLSTPDGLVRAKGGDGKDHVETAVGGYRLEVDLVADRAPTIHYGGERHDYAFGGNTFYYSRTSLATRGRVITPTGARLEVTGQSWFDRQWGELVPSVLVGWQWFAIQLDDGRQLILYTYNRRPSENLGAIVDASGARPLRATDLSVIVTDTWQSPHASHIRYPAGWQVAVNGGPSLTLEPVLADQEMAAKFWVGPEYWEGVCRVRGTRGESGHAFVELVGFTPPGGWLSRAEAR